jgi:hypothetical protein
VHICALTRERNPLPPTTTADTNASPMPLANACRQSMRSKVTTSPQLQILHCVKGDQTWTQTYMHLPSVPQMNVPSRGEGTETLSVITDNSRIA